MYYPFMAASTKKVLPKKKGRPATGKDPVLTFRSPTELTERIERHADSIDKPRSEAIRRLVERALNVTAPEPGQSAKRPVRPVKRKPVEKPE